ncbi:MAG: SGNH/GDSL hydrolase family protein [Thermodesulfobacteriota bacterium]
MTYNPRYGWSGIPHSEATLVTENNSILIKNNNQGYRDIEHQSSEMRPAVVFLGDSFTYGYEVEYNEMFVNLLREMLLDYEVFNLSQRGYGTDQELLIFEDWQYKGPLELVVLMFSENDITDNNAQVRYGKPKPKFQIINDSITLTGVPVPNIANWTKDSKPKLKENYWLESLKSTFFNSHFIHDLYFRLKLLKLYKENNWQLPTLIQQDITLTKEILKKLNKKVDEKGAKLILFFIPSKLEIEELIESTPYQESVREICNELEIKCVDLAEPIKNSERRTYFRKGSHWNPTGHHIAAQAIYKSLIYESDLKEVNK